MRITISLTVLLLSILFASSVYAQRVESGYVINSSALLGSHDRKRGNTEQELKFDNRGVYHRLAVANWDGTCTWSGAFSICTGISGGGWRVPTQRELMLMYVLKHELEKQPGFVPFHKNSAHYWSATEGYGNGWGMKFDTGYVVTIDKERYGLCRCVKEM